jgi:tol-pal system protein YbgF
VSHILISRQLLGVALAVLMVAPFLVVQPSWARNTPAPVVDATGAGVSGSTSGTSLEARLSRLENQTLLGLMERMDNLQNEVQQMLSELEEQAHGMEGLKKRQRDLYLDIDQRLRKIEQGNAAAPTLGRTPAMGAFVPAPAPTSTVNVSSSSTSSAASPVPAEAGQAVTPDGSADSRQERVSYERAFGLLKDGHYDKAVAAFKAFVQSYPKGLFAGNAQYWLGEANYVQRNFKQALSEFGKVVKDYPTSPKRADAMLKMGYTYQELGQLDEARLSLANVSKNYPDSTAASLAQKRLQDLKRLR